MIEDRVEIVPKTIVRHDEGLLYRVDKVDRYNAIGWEEARKLGGKLIDYTQLEDGQFPAGTQYGKDEASFRRCFTIVSLPISRVTVEVVDELGDD
jgi:hypothetical protein